MVKVIVNGCNGHMGRFIIDIISGYDDTEVVAGIDIADDGRNDFPVFDSFDKCNIKADVVIDFSNPRAVPALLKYCRDTGTGVVLCTTGLDEGILKDAEETSKKVPLLRSANMSLGINLLLEILKPVSKKLAAAGFDIEIVERHHKRKLDAPSGTALALADSINEALSEEYEYTYDRSKRSEKRREKEIGISAVRGGSIVGEHEVIFAGQDEVVEFKHTAYSRALFAKGAVEAARFLLGAKPGYYSMKDVINSEN
ncbi:MAG: 4-hydroxy-tetrahydrodipicolinate reductase [Lachnospiraceae bacterium]|nr:4-hydroxy-tetrahydrodipicolinate reductase [Lachnospiraceae bacterium]